MASSSWLSMNDASHCPQGWGSVICDCHCRDAKKLLWDGLKSAWSCPGPAQQGCKCITLTSLLFLAFTNAHLTFISPNHLLPVHPGLLLYSCLPLRHTHAIFSSLFEGLVASQVALVVKNPPANAGDARDKGSISGLGRSPGGGNGNPLQYSSLENSMDRGAWWAAVHGVTKKSDTTEVF